MLDGMHLQGPAIAARHMQWEGMSAEPCDLLFGSDILYDPGKLPGIELLHKACSHDAWPLTPDERRMCGIATGAW